MKKNILIIKHITKLTHQYQTMVQKYFIKENKKWKIRKTTKKN